MEDRNPLPYDRVVARLASPETLAAAIEELRDVLGAEERAWDEVGRLAYAGIVVRHAELKLPLPGDVCQRAIEWLEAEDLDWEEDAHQRDRRRQREIGLLREAQGA
jgi:hypothetical protein